MNRGSLLVPLYVHPAVDPGAWRTLVESADLLYGVVLNVADGPGTAPDPAFAAVAGELRAAGVRVLGYVDTAYGRRPTHAVLADLFHHSTWYGTDGVFLDQAASDGGLVGHYRRLARTARACGSQTVVLNPGVHPAPGYAQVADLLVTFEGSWATYRTAAPVPAWTGTYPAERFCHLVYDVPAGLRGLVSRTARLRGAAVHCAVPGSGANPWQGVSSDLTDHSRESRSASTSAARHHQQEESS
ncbi:spherulation-specific family 4 protein [Streptomyces sp. H10-C2]|uniref:spherulation-specific family 4 protein n=1 Tax=unclassified Streptomyces TaxID=2593676 RepID=UPI0024BBCB43|nr:MULTISPECIES: spherulation-specific family 4 protein [unclassified Streptomyces]MDJ0344971.1 spherulation-specific family 4 protein [Streptomyces sp. PH10-H1]MDJ0373948.1 spherulation-specific family 4 protein [Streptomyces sp. H10-C2]